MAGKIDEIVERAIQTMPVFSEVRVYRFRDRYDITLSRIIKMKEVPEQVIEACQLIASYFDSCNITLISERSGNFVTPDRVKIL
jgi:hypothetical protein